VAWPLPPRAQQTTAPVIGYPSEVGQATANPGSPIGSQAKTSAREGARDQESTADQARDFGRKWTQSGPRLWSMIGGWQLLRRPFEERSSTCSRAPPVQRGGSRF
jgi:hypothetical protein